MGAGELGDSEIPVNGFNRVWDHAGRWRTQDEIQGRNVNGFLCESTST